ncbi:HGL112Cp [Eremothecium sinecaudum]|uniref:HGL112Cp n=1 Tax=Eremothecium sinecaudum TaxID=45286 RepID=A0A109UZZ4_9SACH|nr:HGL112Cp [Eremothecium sinecaudum]AMD22228.1 HGL112Cp [Eremothecium sinecaudum]
MPLKWTSRGKKATASTASPFSKTGGYSGTNVADEDRTVGASRGSFSASSSPTSKGKVLRQSHSHGSIYSDEPTTKGSQLSQGLPAALTVAPGPGQGSQQQSGHRRLESADNGKQQGAGSDSGAEASAVVSQGQTRSVQAGKSSMVPQPETLNPETYDSTVFKLGWVNKANSGPALSGSHRESRYSHQVSMSISSLGTDRQSQYTSGVASNGQSHTNANFRVHKAQLKGCVLTLYKSGLGNVKFFDPSLEPTMHIQSGPQRQDTVDNNGTCSQSQVQQSGEYSSPSLPTGEPISFDAIPKLEYLSVTYPHPHLHLDQEGRVLSGSIESLCHAVLFAPSDSVTKPSDILLLLPLLESFNKTLSYFNAFRMAFSKRKSATQTSLSGKSQQCLISAESDNLITERLVLVLRTILDVFSGFLLDDLTFQLVVALLDTISLHDEDVSQNMKLLIVERQAELTKLTAFANEPLDSSKLDALLNVESFLKLDADTIVRQIHGINMKFSKSWGPQLDYSLLYDSQYSSKHAKLNPLLFSNNGNIQYLGRLLVTHVFCLDSSVSPRRRADILSRWVQLGCKFERLGDMVSWLAIATIICSIPTLRLIKTWQHVPDSYLKIIFKGWVPTIVQLDRRQVSSRTTNSVFILAPPNLNDKFIRENVIPYFGDLVIRATDLPKETKFKYLDKKIRRTKNAFYKWQQRLEQETLNHPDTESDSKNKLATGNSESENLDFYQYWKYHVGLPPMNIENIMEMSLKVEPPSISEESYSRMITGQSYVASGGYLPVVFTSLLPNYSLFPKELLITAGTVNSNKIGQMPKIFTDNFKQTHFNDIKDIAGSTNVSAHLAKDLSSEVLDKMIVLKHDIKKAEVDIKTLNVSHDVVFKVIRESTEREADSESVFVSPRRNSQGSSQPDISSMSTKLDVLEFFNDSDSSSVRQDDVELHVVLKSASLEKLFDFLVLKSSVFCNIITTEDIAEYFSIRKKSTTSEEIKEYFTINKKEEPVKDFTLKSSNIRLLDFAALSVVMDHGLFTEVFFNTYKSFTTTLSVLENLAKRFIGAKSCVSSIGNLDKLGVKENAADLIKDHELKDTSRASLLSTSEYENKRFPVWDIKVTNFDVSQWSSLAKIQICVLEALYHLLKEHYSDFTDDMANNKTFLDILKIINQEVHEEWDKRIKSLKVASDVDIENAYLSELIELQQKLQDLFNKIKSVYQRQLYRPLGVTRSCRKVTELLESFQAQNMSAIILNGSTDSVDEMALEFQALKYDSIESIVSWVYRLDSFISDKLKLVSVKDWMQLTHILESLTSDSLTSFFKFPLRSVAEELVASGNSQLDGLPILSIFPWLTNLEDSDNTPIIERLPQSIHLLCKIHASLTHFFIVHICHPHLSLESRNNTFAVILQLLKFVRAKNSAIKLVHSRQPEKEVTSEQSNHVPSFIETALTDAIVSAESRLFEMSWKEAYHRVGGSFNEKVPFIGTIFNKLEISDEKLLEIESKQRTKLKLFSPCPGWLTCRLLEIIQLIPNMSVESPKLINFDKRRFTNDIIKNYNDIVLSMEKVFEKKKEKAGYGSILFYGSEASKAFKKAVKDAATNEARQLKYQATGLFNDILVAEVYKVQRDQQKLDELVIMERDYKKTASFVNYAKQSLSSSTIASTNSTVSQQKTMNAQNSNSSPNNSSSGTKQTRHSVTARCSVISGYPTPAASGTSSSIPSSTSHHSGMGKKIGGFLRRPFSISGFSTSLQYAANNVMLSGVQTNGSISPYELPEISAEIQDTKPTMTIKTFEIKSCIKLNNYRQDPDIMHCFKIVMEDGNQYTLQSISEPDMNEWMKAITLSKRYSFHSKKFKGKTSNKIFGVPVEDVCEREGTLIPNIIIKLLDEIESRGLDEVGLYRVPGSVGSINALKNAFDEEGAINNTFTLDDSRWFEINTIAGCFKLYLRELPESLFLNDKVEDFVGVMAKFKSKEIDLPTFQKDIRALLRVLPVYNYHILKRLFLHLKKVHQHVENNRMDASNLAIVFSMSFINQDDLASTMGPMLGSLQTLLQYLIKNPEHYFD